VTHGIFWHYCVFLALTFVRLCVVSIHRIAEKESSRPPPYSAGRIGVLDRGRAVLQEGCNECTVVREYLFPETQISIFPSYKMAEWEKARLTL